MDVYWDYTSVLSGGVSVLSGGVVHVQSGEGSENLLHKEDSKSDSKRSFLSPEVNKVSHKLETISCSVVSGWLCVQLSINNA